MLIGGFNESCKNIATSYLKVGGGYMSVIPFWTTGKCNLPHLSYIVCTPESLGTEFKTVIYSFNVYLLLVDIHIRKEGTNNRNYHLQLVTTATCTKRTME